MAVREIEQRHYDPDLLKPGSLVFDLGALRGVFSDELSALGHRVIAFEPDPSGIHSVHAKEKVTVVQKAMGFPGGIRIFHQYQPSGGANSLLNNDKEKQQNPGSDIEVEVITLEEAVNQYGIPDLLKMNVEGAEVEILMNTPKDILSKIGQITVSFHFFCGVITKEQMEQCKDRLINFGFTIHTYPEYPDECWAVKY